MNSLVKNENHDVLVSLCDAGVVSGLRWLVRDVSFDVRRGEIVTIIGPNGSGKSTTAKMALGIVKPNSGTVHRKKNLKIGYVPQKLSIDSTLPLPVHRLMTLTSQLDKSSMITALRLTGMFTLLNSDVKSLSGGELQRVLIARAIALKPDFLMLDEPARGLDLTGALSLYQLVTKIRNELNCAVLIISHDLHLVMSATDQVICLNGHVCCQGPPTAVVENEEYQKLFGTYRPDLLSVYEHEHDHVHLSDGRVKHKDGSITPHFRDFSLSDRKINKEASEFC
ncbi:metal ABC transporter ATP-binding protein [Candidatus Endowatersipora endosymbiont of Watersipora subatra]|uniref:metal ABC transporter ATP-binding protein n=1 Tax=Candidatus Endowatersipora endosymbiont of Watersipora subatra TaxID=3077946 RepID=UPI00312CBEC8